MILFLEDIQQLGVWKKTGNNGWMNILINKTREIEEKETLTHFGRKKKR